MGYYDVDAVNQQIPADVSPGALLVLTKFAELLPNNGITRRRVGKERLITITHMDYKTVSRHLKELHSAGYLLCLEDGKLKRPGARPLLYELCLPDGFNKNQIDSRRGCYYGGRKVEFVYKEENATETLYPDGLPPVMAGGDLSGVRDNLSDLTDNLSDVRDNLSDVRDKIPPFNTSIPSKDNISRKEDEMKVSEAKKAAAEATHSKPEVFAKCGITASNAPLVIETVDFFKKYAADNPGRVKCPVPYLITLIKGSIAAGGVDSLVGKLTPSQNEAASASTEWNDGGACAEGWKQLVKELELGSLPKDKLEGLRSDFFEKLGLHLPEDIPGHVSVFLKDLQYKNGKSYEEMRQRIPSIDERASVVKAELDA